MFYKLLNKIVVPEDLTKCVAQGAVGMMLQIYKENGYDLCAKPNIFFNPAPNTPSPIPTMGERGGQYPHFL
ncbi:MAG: hypothetical protein J6T56_08920 [Bacteroidales bacterium]|nr:hypothetical protein [Bacteroidales bacterium]